MPKLTEYLNSYSMYTHGSPDGNKKPLPPETVVLPMLAGDFRSPDKTEQNPDLGQALVWTAGKCCPNKQSKNC